MIARSLSRNLMLLLCLVALSAAAPPARAQVFDPLGGSDGGFGGMFGGADKKVAVQSQFTSATDDHPSLLFITATITPTWYVYSTTQPPGGPKPSKIKLDPSADFKLLGDFHPTSPPKKKVDPVFNNLTVETHHGTVTWYAPIEIRGGIDPATLTIQGQLFAQLCDPTTCLPGRDFPFTATLGPGMEVPDRLPAEVPGPVPAEVPSELPTEPRSPGGAKPQLPPPGPAAKAEAGSTLPWRPYTTFEGFRALLGPSFDPEILKSNIKDESNLLWNVLLAFGGGILLNLMPCVLPVIGLKVLSFVEQAGHDRRRALTLNIWYSAGLLSIFLLLASLAVFLNLGWGHLFKYPAFNIVLAGVVFAMGLSFLGVWEIPIPGFVGSGKAVAAAENEGLRAAFAKGVITTILATPCTGPFMGTALAWAASQSPLNTYAVFTSIGLGMASPYLLIGAFPALVRFLPKPGAWMDTFKQVMGFVLLATTVYIFTFLKWPFVVPTIGLLFAVWVACWWIARTPGTAEAGDKARAWLEAAVVVGVGWLLLFPGIDELVKGRFAFGGLADVMNARFEERLERTLTLHEEKLKWEGYELVYTGRKGDFPSGSNTVLVDFTADWCLTCKTFEATVLNTPEVKELVEANGVITLKADWTDEAPEVTKLMQYLRAQAVPTIAIFPANDPNNPSGLFRGGYTQADVLRALKEAGPSKTAG